MSYHWLKPAEVQPGVFRAIADGRRERIYFPIEPGEDVPLLYLQHERRPYSSDHAGVRVGRVRALWDVGGDLVAEFELDMSKAAAHEALEEIRTGALAVSVGAAVCKWLPVARLIELTLTPRPADASAKLLNSVDVDLYQRKSGELDPRRRVLLAAAQELFEAPAYRGFVTDWQRQLSPQVEELREGVHKAVTAAVAQAMRDAGLVA